MDAVRAGLAGSASPVALFRAVWLVTSELEATARSWSSPESEVVLVLITSNATTPSGGLLTRFTLPQYGVDCAPGLAQLACAVLLELLLLDPMSEYGRFRRYLGQMRSSKHVGILLRSMCLPTPSTSPCKAPSSSSSPRRLAGRVASRNRRQSLRRWRILRTRAVRSIAQLRSRLLPFTSSFTISRLSRSLCLALNRVLDAQMPPAFGPSAMDARVGDLFPKNQKPVFGKTQQAREWKQGVMSVTSSEWLIQLKTTEYCDGRVKDLQERLKLDAHRVQAASGNLSFFDFVDMLVSGLPPVSLCACR